MTLTFAILLGFLLDWVFGDPPQVWHPVCTIGKWIALCTALLRRLCKRPLSQLLGGVVLWLLTCGGAFAIPFFLLRWLRGIHPGFAFVVETLMCYQIFARKSLADAGADVQNALTVSIKEGRTAIAKYVGRDTSALSGEAIIQAAVETIAENLNDGVIAPLLYLLIGGAPLGFLYKAVNTLDSMVGYHNEQYEYLGKFSARMDDGFGFVPARLSAICLIAATGMLGMDSQNALRVFQRDRNKHKSPNAGQTEAACAGALYIQLGGDATYFGKVVSKATLGDPTRTPTKADIGRACDLMTTASVLALVCGCVLRLTLPLMQQWSFFG